MINGEPKIMMGSNNYLGLTHHPKVLAAAEAALKRYGSGCTGSRFLNGTLDLHEELEARLAQFLGKEAALRGEVGHFLLRCPGGRRGGGPPPRTNSAISGLSAMTVAGRCQR